MQRKRAATGVQMAAGRLIARRARNGATIGKERLGRDAGGQPQTIISTKLQSRHEADKRLADTVQSPVRSPAIQSLSTFAIVYCFVVMVAAYTARGASGFGAAVAMPLLGLVMPLKILVPAWTLIARRRRRRAARRGPQAHRLAGDLQAPARLPDRHRRRALRVHPARPRRWRTWLGVLVLLYGLYSLAGTFRADLKPKLPRPVAAGVRRFRRRHDRHRARHLGSVFFAMYFDAIRLAKEQYRATMTAILFTLTRAARHRLLGGRRVHPRGAGRQPRFCWCRC